MYVVNSYLHVLKNIDSSWGDSTGSSGSRSSSRAWGRKKSRVSSSRSSRKSNRNTSYASGSESGLFSEELVNSGYYGDDEVERCRCLKCLAAADAQARKPKQDFTAEYEIISVDLSACSTPKQDTSISLISKSQVPDFDDYIVIPSSKEEFLSGDIVHSTPVKANVTPRLETSPDSKTDCSVNLSTQNKIDKQCACKLLEDAEQSQAPVQKATALRWAAKLGGNCWWRDNIVWQLQQRNDAQTKSFVQFQTDKQKCRAKVKINKELADYLNRYAELRPQAKAVSSPVWVHTEVDPIEKSELVLAIRSHGAVGDEAQSATRARSDSIAHLATTYLRNQRTIVEQKVSESDESDWSGCQKARMSGRGSRRDRSGSRKWRESIASQLQMRNFLECKYFTDAIARRTMSQMSISENGAVADRNIADYDIITDEEIGSLDSRSTVMNSSHSTSQGYHSSPVSSRRFSFRRGRHR